MKKKIRSKPPSEEILLYADSDANADMRYFAGVSVPDPFIAFTSQGRRIAVLSQLEYARGQREGLFDEVLPLENLLKQRSVRRGFPGSVIRELAKQFRIRAFRVSPEFPCGVAFALREAGVKLQVAEEGLFPEREIKRDEEAELIRKGNAASAAGFRVVEKLLRAAEIRKGYLYHGGRRLTSERVQQAIAVACLERGAIASKTIVAGGNQACDPHCRGSGPLKADELIIVDIFPRLEASGYHGDMTRTYLKGRPSESQKALYTTVFEAEQFALKAHRSGKSGAKIYREVCAYFEKQGYPTTREAGVPVGFIHGLGHGLGLEVHEPPRVNPGGSRLKKGQVITVEPGLYYPGLGGARVEDVVRVQAKAPELLSKHPYRWRIR